MKRVWYQLLLLLVLFFGTWRLLSSINFMKIFDIEKKVAVNEKKLGDIIWEVIAKTEHVVKDTSVNNNLQLLKQQICNANGIPADDIHVYVIEKEEVNAFALPNRRIVIYSGLMAACQNAEELCSVMAHEIAHITGNHVMKKMMKEAGITLVSAVMGSGNTEVVREIIQLLSSSAYDRSLEKEADMQAAVYLCKAGIDPENMANFFLRLAKNEKLPQAASWISTHPHSRERAANILQWKQQHNCLTGFQFEAARWQVLQDKLR